jgi:hypothetical protein
LYSTLAEQAQYVEYYKSVPPVACPTHGVPLKQGPGAAPGVLYCPDGDFYYPDDWDPQTMSGM